MTGFIPKEKLTAYQRWELEAFDEHDPSDGDELDLSTIIASKRQSGVILKENLTAYERWEGAAFDKEKELAAAEAARDAPPEEPAPSAEALLDAADPDHLKHLDGVDNVDGIDNPEAPDDPENPLSDGAHPEDESELQVAIVLPTAAEVEEIRQQAHEQGYAEGQEAGRTDGWAEGSRDGLAAAKEGAESINALLTTLANSLQTIDQRVADQLLATAVELSSQLIRHSLRIKPELVLPVVKEALAVLNPGSAQPVLFLHPEDATLVRANLNELLTHHEWKIFEDATLTRGGCRVELGSGEVDATIETRWRRLLESIGLNDAWLDTLPPLH